MCYTATSTGRKSTSLLGMDKLNAAATDLEKTQSQPWKVYTMDEPNVAATDLEKIQSRP
jgi:hypothetical protein